MLLKLIADIPISQLRKRIRDYYPPPYLITVKQSPHKQQTEFCIQLDDSPAKPLAYDIASSTGIIFAVNRENMFLHIEHLNVHIYKRLHGISNNLLAPLWTIYKDFGFNYISLYSTNNSFWRHIQKKLPWINFQITFNLKNE